MGACLGSQVHLEILVLHNHHKYTGYEECYPYEAILTYDPARACVRVSPDMLHSFQPPTNPPSVSDQGIDIWYPQGSGKTHISQMGHWSIMSDRPSFEPTDYLAHQPDTTAELNINRSYGDLLDVSTTYLGTDLIRKTDVFNAQPSFPITLDCHTNGELPEGGKMDILLDTGASKSYMSKAFYMCHVHLHHFPKFQSVMRHLQVGNGALVSALFAIPFERRTARYPLSSPVLNQRTKSETP